MRENIKLLHENKIRRNIAEYDTLRVIITLLVLIGHSTYYRIMTQYGGCDYTALTFPGLSSFYRLADYMVSLIYLFHMPLYMALSGVLYRLKIYTHSEMSDVKRVNHRRSK